jgi:hypothetical protein
VINSRVRKGKPLANQGRFRNCWTKLTGGVLGLLVLAAPGLAWPGGEKTYISKQYGYGFHYPAEGALQEVAAGAYVDMSFQGRRLPTLSVQSLDETGKEARKGAPDLWGEFILEQAKLSCDADGPDGTVYCKGVARKNAWKTRGGLRVVELYLQQVEERYGEPDKITTTDVGPIYAVDISRQGYVFGLMVGSGHDYPRTSAERELVRRIVENVYLIPDSEFQPPKPRIVGPGPLFEGRPGKAVMPAPGK